MRKKRFFITLMLSFAMVFTTCMSVLADTDIVETEPMSVTEITSESELEDAIDEAFENGKMSNAEKQEIIENADPKIIEEYVEDTVDNAMEEVEDINIDSEMIYDNDGDGYFKKTIDLDNHCSATVEFEDCEDEALNFIDDEANAASNGEKKYKDYGNRYYTAKVSVQCGVGYAVLYLENHYKVSKIGITENFGDSYAECVGFGGSVSAGKPTITQSKATSVGQSIKMYSRYTVRVGAKNVGGTFSSKITASVKLVKKDTSHKRMYVQHNWTHV